MIRSRFQVAPGEIKRLDLFSGRKYRGSAGPEFRKLLKMAR